MKKYCMYHSSDLDGRSSAAIVNKFMGVDEYIPYNYKELPDLSTIVAGDYLFIVDCTPTSKDASDLETPRFDIMHDLVRNGAKVVWIDHHEDVINQYEDWCQDNHMLYGEEFQVLPGLRTPKYAACELTWRYMTAMFSKPSTPPSAIEFLGKYDSWRHEMEPAILDFHTGMSQKPWWPDDPEWDQLLTGPWSDLAEDILVQGKYIRKYHDTMVDRILWSSASVVRWKGLTLIACNTHLYSSIDFMRMRDKVMAEHAEPIHGCVMYYRLKGKKWKYSIRSFNDETHPVDHIAREYGGNGHPGAAGFVTDEMLTEVYADELPYGL